jgi:hypothetical protein
LIPEVSLKRIDRRAALRRGGLALTAALFTGSETDAQQASCNCTKATDGTPLDTGTSELRPVIERYDVELRNLNRVYSLAGSPTRQSKLEGFYTDQFRLLDGMRFDALSQSGKIDYILFRARLEREKKELANEARLDAEVEPLIPFQQTVLGFEEARRRMETVDPQ